VSFHVAVLSGGLSLEREVSLHSGRRVAEGLAERGHEVSEFDVDERLIRQLRSGDFDLAYLCLHGRPGEDGTIQGMLDLLGLPYTGPGALASHLAFDKPLAKAALAREGVATPDSLTISVMAFREMGAAALLDQAVARLGLPLVVKPARGGSSLGLRIVGEASGLPAALIGAFAYDNRVLLERFVTGVEVAIAVREGLDGSPEALLPVEIVPREGAYDFNARYSIGATEFFIPARIDPDATAACTEAAMASHRVLNCADLSRTDLIVDGQGKPWVLEVNTCPGMTETSLVPLSAEAAGIEFPDLVDGVVKRALARRST